MKTRMIAGLVAVGLAATAAAQEAPFGTDTEAAYAADLWTVMDSMNLVGADMVRSFPYDGIDPHGKMLETFYTRATVNGHTGTLVVKRNYGPEGVTVDQVLNDPEKHLGAFTVMCRREIGDDEDNQNGFWAKYLPDGSLDKNPKGMRLAGRVAKGADTGCIACHSSEADYIFTTDAITD